MEEEEYGFEQDDSMIQLRELLHETSAELSIEQHADAHSQQHHLSHLVKELPPLPVELSQMSELQPQSRGDNNSAEPRPPRKMTGARASLRH